MISSAKGSGYLTAGFEVRLDVLLHGERDIRVADPLAERLPADLGITAIRSTA
jgi:hypothetical protein